MKTLDVFGPYTGPTGYDNLVRGFTQGLMKHGVDVALKNFDKWSGFRVAYDQHFDELAKKRPLGHSRVMMNFCLPPQAEYNENQFNTIYTMFEGTQVNELWAKMASSMDMVVVPTESSREAFLNRGVRESIIKKVPLGINTEIYNTEAQPAKIFDEEFKSLEHYPIRVMNMQELGPRKNIEGLLKAWMIGTKSGFMKDHSCLILKLSAYSPNRYGKMVRVVEEVRKELGITKNEHAPIMVSCRMYNDHDLPHYMGAATHYISMSKGEGWDLPAMQAAALGNIIIVPHHSSYREWVNQDLVNSIEEYKEEEAVATEPQLAEVYQDSKWFIPDVDAFASRINDLHNSMESDQKSAIEFSKEVVAKYSWEEASEHMMKLLDEEAYNHQPGEPKLDIGEKYQSPDRKYPDAEEMPQVICQWCKNIGKPCGIANYTSSIVEEMMKSGVKRIGYVGGECRAHDMLTSNNKYGIENIQLEYQFASPNRLAYMLQNLRERGVKSVVTMHTFNEDAAHHNRVIFRHADEVFVHSEMMKQKMAEAFYPTDKVRVMKMPVPKLMTPEEFKDIDCSKLPSNRFKIGYYGFLYFHKGVEKLIHAFAKVKEKIPEAFLVLHASKPDNTQDDVAARVMKAIEQHGLIASRDYFWFSNYEEDERKAIAILSQCDLNVLPYDHYGSYGTSAAAGSILAAGQPALVSDVCWFANIYDDVVQKYDVQKNKIDEIDELAGAIEACKDTIDDEVMREAWKKNIAEYAYSHSITEVASQHLEAYREITGIDFRV